ncbi:MAG: hypothetical protein KH138_06440 [Firmicutes bacterium]|nr:hypothetical protein [Bacillota bacterium]
MKQYKTIISTWTMSMPGQGDIVFEYRDDNFCAKICEIESDYEKMLETQKWRIENNSRFWINDFSIEEFEKSFRYDHKVFCTDENDLHIIELDARQREISHKTIPLTCFPEGYLYVTEGRIFEDKEERIFARSNLFVDVFPTQNAALEALKARFSSYINPRVDWMSEEGDSPEEIEETMENIFPSYRFWINKISVDRYPVVLDGDSSLLQEWYDPKTVDRSTPDILYHELMRLILFESHIYSASFRKMNSIWHISDVEYAYKSYDDFVNNSSSKFAAGDYVETMRSRREGTFPYSSAIWQVIIEEHQEKELGYSYYGAGRYVVAPTWSQTPIMQSQNPLFWTRGVSLEGFNEHGEYDYVEFEEMPEYLCRKIPEEDVPRNSFLELTRELILHETTIPLEGHNRDLESGHVDVFATDCFPYTKLKLFRELLESRGAEARMIPSSGFMPQKPLE